MGLVQRICGEEATREYAQEKKRRKKRGNYDSINQLKLPVTHDTVQLEQKIKSVEIKGGHAFSIPDRQKIH